MPDSTIPDHPTFPAVAEAGEVSLDVDVETVDSDSNGYGGGWLEGSADTPLIITPISLLGFSSGDWGR